MDNSFLFGLSEDTWLVIALTFFCVSGLRFLWSWWSGFLRDKSSGEKIKYPWE